MIAKSTCVLRLFLHHFIWVVMALPGQTLKPLICQFDWIKALEGGAYSDPIEIMYVLVEARIIINHLSYLWESYIRSEICRFLFHLYFRSI